MITRACFYKALYTEFGFYRRMETWLELCWCWFLGFVLVGWLVFVFGGWDVWCFCSFVFVSCFNLLFRIMVGAATSSTVVTIEFRLPLAL